MGARSNKKARTRREVLAELGGLRDASDFGTTYWFEDLPPHMRGQMEFPTVTTTITYPRRGAPVRDVGEAVNRNDPHTICEVVQPYRPSDPEYIESGASGMHVPAVWTVDEVRAWLKEAMETLRLCKGHWPAGARSGMPDIVRTAIEAYGYGDAPIRRVPTAREFTRMDMCLPWLYLITDLDYRKAVVGTALGLSLRAVGRVVGCGKDTARAWEQAGLSIIVAHLNERKG